MSYDFILWIYRRNNPGMTWGDLTGEWPQPVWRTELDLWYFGIKGEVDALKSKQDQAAAAAAAEQARQNQSNSRRWGR